MQQRKKPASPKGQAGFLKITRQHLLSHLQYYHRLWKLNGRVRKGNGCGLPDMVTGKRAAGGEACDTRLSWLWFLWLQAAKIQSRDSFSHIE